MRNDTSNFNEPTEDFVSSDEFTISEDPAEQLATDNQAGARTPHSRQEDVNNLEITNVFQKVSDGSSRIGDASSPGDSQEENPSDGEFLPITELFAGTTNNNPESRAGDQQATEDQVENPAETTDEAGVSVPDADSGPENADPANPEGLTIPAEIEATQSAGGSKFEKLNDRELLNHVTKLGQDGAQISEMREAAAEFVARADRKLTAEDKKGSEEAFKKIQKALTTGKWPGIGADGTPTEVNLTPEKRLDCHRAVVGDMEMMAIQVEARLMVADIFRQSGHFSDAENWLLEARQLADELPLSDIAKESKQLDNQEQTYHYSDGNRRIPFLSAGLGLRGGFWPGDMKAVTDYDNQELPTTLAELKKLKARPIEESQRAFIKRNIVKEAMESNPRPDGIINLPVTVRAQLVGLYLTTPSGQTHPFKPLDAFNTALEARNKFALNRTLLNDGELDPNHELIDHPAVILAFQAVNEVFSNPEKYGLGASGLPAPRISSIEQWSKDYLRRAGKR